MQFRYAYDPLKCGTLIVRVMVRHLRISSLLCSRSHDRPASPTTTSPTNMQSLFPDHYRTASTANSHCDDRASETGR